MRIRSKPKRTKGERVSLMLLFSYFTVIFIPLAVVLSAIGWWALYRGAELRMDNMGGRESAQVEFAKQIIHEEFRTVIADLLILAESPSLKSYLKTGNESERYQLDSYLRTFSQLKKGYRNLGFIEVQDTGRVNNIRPEPGVIRITAADGREDNGRTAITIKFITQVFDRNDSLRGTMVLEYHTTDLLQGFLDAISAGTGRGILLQESGEVLAALQRELQISGAAAETGFAGLYPGEWRVISGLREGRLNTDNGLFAYSKLELAAAVDKSGLAVTQDVPDPPALSWILVSHIPHERLPSPSLSQYPFEITAFLIFLCVAALLFSYAASVKSSQEASQRNLRASQNRFRVIFQEAGLGIAITDLSGGILYANPALQKMLAYEETELKKMQRRQFMDGEDADHLARLYRKLLKGEGNLYTAEMQYISKEGRRVYTEVNMTLIKDVTGQPQFIVLFIDDMTERKQILDKSRVLQDQLVQMDRISAIGEMGTTIAHELNNPLGAIVNYAAGSLNWLEQGGKDPKELLVPLQKTLNQARHAGEIIRRLRGYLKTSEEEGELKNVRVAVDQVIQLIEVQAKRSQVAIRVDLADDLPTLRCGQVQLEQVLVNILLNAIQAIEKAEIEAPKIVISARLADSNLMRISIEDNGPGVSEPEKIFEPFYSTKAQGLGLGLSICTTIVESWSGQIWAEHGSEGGLLISFTVPHV